MTFISVTKDRHNGRIAIAVKKGIPHTCIDLPHLLSAEATMVCIQTGNSAMFLEAVYDHHKDCGVTQTSTELLGFRNKSIQACDLNAKHPVWNRKVSKPSGLKLLEILLVLTPKFQLHNAVLITHLMVEAMFSTF
jgi:hypothetical protein